MSKIPLTGVFDKNGQPVQNTFIKVPEVNPGLDASQINNYMNNQNPNFINQKIPQQFGPNQGPPKKNRKLFFDAIGGLVSSATKSVSGLLGSPSGGEDGQGSGVLGALATPGGGVGMAAAGAGMMARKARKEQFYFDKTQLELQTNFQSFRSEYLELEYSTLRECNIHSAKINGLLSSLEKNMVYRLNSRILEMIDAK